MKRTPLERATAKARAWLNKRSELPKTNAKRKAKRTTVDLVYGSFFRYVGTLPCAVRGEDECFGKVIGHHLKSVGAGGGDAGNLAPLCTKHHRLIHDIGRERFNDRFFNDLNIYAAAIWSQYQEQFHKEDEDG